MISSLSRKKMRSSLIVTLFSILALSSLAQEDSKHFDFWEGTWHQIIDGKVDTTATRFEVGRGIHRYFLAESWYMAEPDGSRFKAFGLRAWDEVNNTWSYVWLSEAGHYQIWECRKVDGHWYNYKNFNINGDKYLSRQAWIPSSETELMRISEKSYDNGKTWQLRFKEYYKKTQGPRSQKG